jgi:hypothetical protein
MYLQLQFYILVKGMQRLILCHCIRRNYVHIVAQLVNSKLVTNSMEPVPS